MQPSIVTVYDAFIWRGEYEQLAREIYDTPPKTMQETVERIPQITARYKQMDWFSEERTKQLQRGIRSANKRLGVLTPKVEKTITELMNGGVEAAHQSVTLGGPAFILNKAATAFKIVSLANNQGISAGAYFCVADYDEVQPELTHMRTPLYGHEGTLARIPVPEGYERSPVYALPLPDIEWYRTIEDNIREGYRPLFKLLDGHTRNLFEERLEQALSVCRWAFVNSQSLGEWGARIIGRLLNIEGNLGMPLFPAANPDLRPLLVKGLEFMLRADIREKFLRSQQRATDLILKNGFKTGLGRREKDYVPFFYECPEKECNRARARLHYRTEGDRAILYGKCPVCDSTIEIEVSKDDPDLSEYAQNLSLRVDSRQFVIDTIIPVAVHVGGPGETAYYGQVIPTAKEMGVPYPAFVKYTRLFFNTPWGERLGKSLVERGIPTLHEGSLFKLIGKVSKFRRKKRFDEMNEAALALHSFIYTRYAEINEFENALRERLAETEGEEQETLLKDRMDVQRYLSWAFGRWATGKMSQESSWSWIEWAINSGFPDIFGPYDRAYIGELKNGGTQFINFSL
ncbi:MAG: hypothetical protein ACTSYL_11105 [Candidatus Thorarchaeota archaeon]